MRRKYGILVGLAVTVAVCILVIHAQPVLIPLNSSQVTTNWVGCLVIGKENGMDRIAPGPYPTTLNRVQIGLRSDGVVVWRNVF